MANNQWTNNKNVKLVGQTSAVPAADYKSANVIDYGELHTVHVVMNASSSPAQADNAMPQIIPVDARVASDSRDPLPGWDYDLSFESGNGDIAVGIQNVISAPSGSLEVVFPVGVKAGQIGVVKAHSGGAVGILKITVI
jgi:hypothetical protein